MKKGGKEFRSSNYYDLLERCKKYPKRLLKIKKKVQMTFAILASGLGYNDVAEFCEYNDFPIMDESSFYDYLHFFDQILDNLVGKICSEKLEAALQKEKFIVGFDAGWAHRRNANQCIGIMIDLLTGLIVSFQIVHHGPENSINLTSTQQHSKSMEKIALKKILNKIKIPDSIKMVFIHDCDIQADSIIQKELPFCEIKYDPNHFIKSQKAIIDYYCSENQILKKLNERIKTFYSSLMHDQDLDLETKIEKWKNMVQHFISTENLSEKDNSETIEILNSLINELIESFSKIDPHFSTNACESFNHARAMIANKDVAWRLSWRIRAFISIIRWNEDDWVKIILNEFQIYEINDSIAKRKKKERKMKRIIERTPEFKKKKANYIKQKKKNKYVSKKNDQNSHKYCDEKMKKKRSYKKSTMPKVPKLSPTQRKITEALRALTKEDKPFISEITIKKYIDTYFDAENSKFAIRIMKSQLTRMVNDGIIIKKRNSYAFLIEEEKVDQLLKNSKI